MVADAGATGGRHEVRGAGREELLRAPARRRHEVAHVDHRLDALQRRREAGPARPGRPARASHPRAPHQGERRTGVGRLRPTAVATGQDADLVTASHRLGHHGTARGAGSSSDEQSHPHSVRLVGPLARHRSGRLPSGRRVGSAAAGTPGGHQLVEHGVAPGVDHLARGVGVVPVDDLAGPLLERDRRRRSRARGRASWRCRTPSSAPCRRAAPRPSRGRWRRWRRRGRARSGPRRRRRRRARG